MTAYLLVIEIIENGRDWTENHFFFSDSDANAITHANDTIIGDTNCEYSQLFKLSGEISLT